jgi:ABC-type nitrate/sulfonate/bicarbonate transport system permease component
MTDLMRRSWPAALLTAALLLLWEAYVRVAAPPPAILPAPSRIAAASLEAAATIWWHTEQTLLQTVVGFLLAVVVAVACALAIDLIAPVRRALFPLLIASQTIPIVALAPLLVLWFGFGMLPKVLVVALVCFFPIVVAMAHGLSAADPDLIRLYRTFGASRRQVFWFVRLPTSLPAFFAGVRIAVTYSVVGAIFAEYVGGFRGLGIFLQTAKNSYRTDLVFGMIAVTAALSLALYGLVALIERLAVPWARPMEGDRGPLRTTAR